MKILVRLSAFAALALAIACGAAATPAATVPPAAQVTYQGFKPDQTTITVVKGQSITWTNKDTAPHTVTAGARTAKTGKFDQRIEASQSQTIKFDEVGEFEYFCSLHQSMNGYKVVVK